MEWTLYTVPINDARSAVAALRWYQRFDPYSPDPEKVVEQYRRFGWVIGKDSL